MHLIVRVLPYAIVKRKPIEVEGNYPACPKHGPQVGKFCKECGALLSIFAGTVYQPAGLWNLLPLSEEIREIPHGTNNPNEFVVIGVDEDGADLSDGGNFSFSPEFVQDSLEGFIQRYGLIFDKLRDLGCTVYPKFGVVAYYD